MAGRDDDANPFAAPESDLEPGTFTPAFDVQVVVDFPANAMVVRGLFEGEGC